MFKNWKNICSRDVVFFTETNIGTRFDKKKLILFDSGLSFPNQNILLKINALWMTALLERRNFSKKMFLPTNSTEIGNNFVFLPAEILLV